MKNAKDSLTKKPFKVFDIIVYAVLAAAIVCLFLFVRPESGRSIEVLYKGERVLIYDLSTNNYSFSDTVEKLSENKFRIKTENGFNDVEINIDKKTATVTDADCAGKECVAMSLNSGAIVCVPHSLVIKYSGEIPSPKVG